jgi:hypothetical protein
MPDSIELTDPAATKIADLLVLGREVAEAADPDEADDDRKWRVWFYTYLMWHESAQLTTRVQGNDGPGRGLMQFEATTAWDTIKIYVLGATPGLVARLAQAANADVQTEMAPALRSFAAMPNPHNVWPTDSPANQIEAWLLNNDRFGMTLMQIQFERFDSVLPPLPPVVPSADPRDPSFRSQHASVWADQWWKGPAAQRPDRIDSFEDSAAALNAALGIA